MKRFEARIYNDNGAYVSTLNFDATDTVDGLPITSRELVIEYLRRYKIIKKDQYPIVDKKGR